MDSIEDILRYAQDDLRKYVLGTMALLRIPAISSYDHLDPIPNGTVPDCKTLPFTVGYRCNMMILLQRFFWMIRHMHRFRDLECMTLLEFWEELVHAEAYTQRILDTEGKIGPLQHPYLHF